MNKYNYRRAIIDDVKDWIVNETDILEGDTKESFDELVDWLYDETFSKDAVTGNGPYYYGTEEICSEYLSNNFNLLYEAARDFYIDDIGCLISHYENEDLARYFDCTIRCYLLNECIIEALKELGIKNDS